MIEIRELIIRANIQDSGGLENNPEQEGISSDNQQGRIEENLGQLIKLIKEKNER